MTQRIACSLALVLLSAGCTSVPLDVAESERVPMNKIYPFPTLDERSRAISKVAIKTVASADLSGTNPDPALRELERHFEDLLTKNGVRTVKRGADYLLRADLAGYQYDAAWKKPTNWLFKTEEAMATRPGVCRHRVEARVLLTVLQKGQATPIRTLELSHMAEVKTESLDSGCPYEASAREALLVEAVRDPLPCVRVAIVNAFAPRGYLVEHRRPTTGGYDLFRSTLTPSMIPEDAPTVEIYRQQLSTTADGARVKDELRIAKGRIAIESENQSTWLEIDLSGATQPLLEGDVVRPVVRKSAVSGLNPWAACHVMLEEG